MEQFTQKCTFKTMCINRELILPLLASITGSQNSVVPVSQVL